MGRRSVVLVAFSAVFLGCAAAGHRGSVAMKVDDREAHICMGAGEVESGDRVALYRNECTGRPQQSKRTPSVGRYGEGGCRRVRLGEGRVVRTLNEHYSVIEVDPGVTFEEGAIVEKL